MAFQVLPILAGLIVGWARKGSLWAIPRINLKLVWVLPISYLIQVVSIHDLNGISYQITLVVSYIGLLIFCGVNYRVPGVLWAMGGTAANFVVMLCNGLRMPAYIPAVEKMAPQLVPLLIRGQYGKSIAMSDSTHLNFLGDIFYFKIPPQSLVSVGDILIAIGLVLFLQDAMRVERRVSSSGKHTSEMVK
ncbi:DUF5317 domain-containing protein [Alicyclobacillus macrosporangiidus]|uniref:DUF5317 domain-containing protein n=1 Tax=Alicyclobacillus macrosporangiidus TaxID=392015 RepID=UPI000497AE73|nr:DUF5317 domain-containing protein [Alicyclobacillus macrosporangiidus]